MIDNNVLGLFDRWNAALATGNPDNVVALYAEDAVLLPTVSNKVRHNHDEIRDYFVAFLAKQPQGVIDESNVRHLSRDLVINSGVYTFTFGDGASVTARFTYLYKRVDGEWKITEHHSSAMPETVTDAPQQDIAAA
ncbi:calcium/calmodulin dependent protein kinase II, association-domain protein [Luminiphilus syltensis NOR5-1B]|uniref:Calcium/calmodulin dependent protein kinase II, association-domain protein n=1 Tax=Luminiphilus syltensis NOR5-1B TaxID=565045 RepID=B8KUW1_9GAMM|nr:SgcJ/EcaC family oxidoreductase [Luminiphilus syltensis]EED35008.1 calcium/calmodulin dependent protein kinase II, association-domain protein [Luminiphilus syltensis NOR5-1B]